MSGRLNLRWKAQVELSVAHASFVVATGGHCTDRKIEQTLIKPVTEINNRLLSASLDIGAFWKRYLLEILRESSMQQACTEALLCSDCNEMQVDATSKAIGSRLRDARLGFLNRLPKLSEQLPLRLKPLRDRWETVGQGLLLDIARQIWGESPSQWWPTTANAMMLQPMRGGDGGFDLESQSLWMEAVLTDVDPEVPEVLRMAWLLTRMAIHSHIQTKSADPSLAKPWSLLSVPLVLSAGKALDLIRSDELPIRRAMELWHFGDADTAHTLSVWWHQVPQSDQPLPAALKILQHQLESSNNQTGE